MLKSMSLQKILSLNNLKDKAFTCSCILMSLIVLSALGSILYTLLSRGLHDFGIHLFIEMTPGAGESGGLANAIFGSVVITFIGVVLAVPLGILIATYLSEERKNSFFAKTIRLLNDTLLSAPSIIIGLFVYTLMVQTMGYFSALAGAVALGLIALPMIIRGTEDVLTLLPSQLREAAASLGLPRWRVTFSIIYRAARTGIFTAVLLSIARIMGETAPLLFTTLNNQFWSSNLLKPMANLPVVIYQYAMSPYSTWQSLAWSGALLIAVIIIVMSAVTRLIFAKGKH